MNTLNSQVRCDYYAYLLHRPKAYLIFKYLQVTSDYACISDAFIRRRKLISGEQTFYYWYTNLDEQYKILYSPTSDLVEEVHHPLHKKYGFSSQVLSNLMTKYNKYFFVVQYLLNIGAQLTLMNFYRAAKYNNLPLVNLLVNIAPIQITELSIMGYNNTRYIHNPTLLEAVRSGNLTVVKFLVPKLSITDLDYEHALQEAAKQGNLDILKYLLDVKPDIDKRVALNAAFISNQLDLVKILVARGAIIDDTNASSLFNYAIDNRSLDLFNYLISLGFNPALDNNVLSKAINSISEFNQNFQILDYLLTHGSLMDDALIIAAEGNYNDPNERVLKYLLRNYTPHVDILNYLLLTVVKSEYIDDIDLVELLINKGANNLNVALLDATDTDIIKYLLKKGADPNYQNSKALINAVTYNKYDKVKILLGHGSNISVRDKSQMPLMAIAAINGYLPIIKLLQKYGASIHIDDELPLRLAAVGGRTETIKYLVNQGANVSAKNNEALRAVATNDRHGIESQIIKFLISKGADPNALTPEQRAKYKV